MIRFCGSWNDNVAIVMERSFFSTVYFVFFYFSLITFLLTVQTSMAELEKDQQIINMNPLYEFSSREDLVQMAGYGEEKLSNVLVTGTLVCEACLHGQSRIRAWPIKGASVTVNCHTNHKGKYVTRAQGVTDDYGDFIVDLPSHLHAIPNLEKSCSVKVVRTPRNSICRPAYAKKHKSITLSSVGNSIRTYTAGDIKLLHLSSKPLRACTRNGNIGEKYIAW